MDGTRRPALTSILLGAVGPAARVGYGGADVTCDYDDRQCRSADVRGARAVLSGAGP